MKTSITEAFDYTFEQLNNKTDHIVNTMDTLMDVATSGLYIMVSIFFIINISKILK